MGRKKIQIKLIQNQRLRNITYNKRKKGLLKKIVELTKLCGIKAKLELKDIFGNLITLDAGQHELSNLKKELSEQKCFRFNAEDYPQFKGFEKMRKKREVVSTQKIQSQSNSPEKLEKFLKFQEKQQNQSLLNKIPYVKIQETQKQAQQHQKYYLQNLSQEIAYNYMKYIQQVQMDQKLSEYIEMVNMNLINNYMRSI